ncbi:hypothetical protein ACH437_10000 [Streptomyces xinghaiensis]|uniref:hypothetical protein n=1 Tax=Streptomyces xinghaiensis TaxID=1038928 RepID=UPI0037B5CFA7
MIPRESNDTSHAYSADSDTPVRYLPVTKNGEVIGYVWASESNDSVSFLRRMTAQHDTFMASVAWSERLDQAEEEGLTPLQALRHWIGAPEDPEAGGIAAAAEELRSPNLRTLETSTNPGHEDPVDEDEGAFDEAMMDRSQGWEDLSPFTLERPGYAFLSEGPIRYLPVTHGEVVLGYLWASKTEDAAYFVKRPAAGVPGTYAEGQWITRLREAKEAGLSPLEALRHWKGEPEDPTAGRIDADAAEQQAKDLRTLEALADQADQDGRP